MATGRIPTTANSPLTVKGDLFGYSTTQARVPVGNDGETLVADSSTSTGLSYQANWAAGKNKIINGDFRFNQRAFTSITTTNTYGFDRWSLGFSDGTVTYTPQTFTLGAAPVAGYEAINFAQIVTTGQTLTTAFANLQQRIESVRTFANQTVTVSFYAKANSGTPNVNVNMLQNFGSGGSPSASVSTNGTVQTITTSWARYSFTITVPSISGKTVGTTNDGYITAQIFVSGGSASNAPTVGIQSNTFQIWGVQVEAGSTSTAFQTATGTIQGELAACQRYYFRNTAGGAYAALSGTKGAFSTTLVQIPVYFPVQMRVKPTSIEYANLVVSDGAGAITPSSVVIGVVSPSMGAADANCTGLTQFRPYTYSDNSAGTGYIAFNAEL